MTYFSNMTLSCCWSNSGPWITWLTPSIEIIQMQLWKESCAAFRETSGHGNAFRITGPFMDKINQSPLDHITDQEQMMRSFDVSFLLSSAYPFNSYKNFSRQMCLPLVGKCLIETKSILTDDVAQPMLMSRNTVCFDRSQDWSFKFTW